MQTIVYFGNENLQILQGDSKNGSLVIDRYIIVPMANGGLINGVITNEGILADALGRAADEHNVDFKNTTLVINTSLAIYKNLQVPKLKPAELEETCHHEFEDSPNYDDLIMDYKGISGKDNATNMFAVALEKGVLESYFHLFEAAGIKLKRVDTALSTMIDYIGSTIDYAGLSFSVYILDGNNLLYTLFENGKYVFSSQARIMAERETEAFTVEIAGKISSLAQFNKSQKSGFVMDRAYFVGISAKELKSLEAYTEGSDVVTSLLPTTANVSEKHALDEEFYLDEGFIVASGFFEQKDAINLHTAYKKAMNPHKGFSFKNKAIIPPIVLAGIFIVGLLGFMIAGLVIQHQINTIDKYVNDESNQAMYSKAKSVEQQMSQVQAATKAYDDTNSAISSYPGFASDKLSQVVGGEGITTTNIEYDMETGVLTFTGTASNQYQAANYVNNLITSGLFKSVDYLGYTYQEGSTVSQTTGTTTGTTTASTPTTSAPTYSFTYTAQMKGGLGQ